MSAISTYQKHKKSLNWKLNGITVFHIVFLREKKNIFSSSCDVIIGAKKNGKEEKKSEMLTIQYPLAVLSSLLSYRHGLRIFFTILIVAVVSYQNTSMQRDNYHKLDIFGSFSRSNKYLRKEKHRRDENNSIISSLAYNGPLMHRYSITEIKRTRL